MVELIVHFQCDTSKKTLPVSPEIERPGKSRGGGVGTLLNAASVAGPNRPSKSKAWGEIRIWRAVDQSCPAWKVLQLATWPDRSPVMNQRVRCSDEPCVKASGTT